MFWGKPQIPMINPHEHLGKTLMQLCGASDEERLLEGADNRLPS